MRTTVPHTTAISHQSRSNALATTLMLALATLLVGALGARRSEAACADTVLVRSAKTYSKTGTSTVLYVDSCTVMPVTGRRFLLEVLRPGGANALTSAQVAYGGVEYFGSDDVDATGTLLSRVITPKGADSTLRVTLVGGAGTSSLVVRVTQVPEPRYGVYTTTLGGASSPKSYTKYFSYAEAVPSSPHVMVLQNGGASLSTTARSQGVEVWVNGQQVLFDSEVTYGRAYLTRSVTLYADNSLQVNFPSGQSSHNVTIRFYGTDDTSPELMVSAPTDGATDTLVTTASKVLRAVQIADAETPVRLYVNGAEQSLSGGVWSDSLSLPAQDGKTTVSFVAENGACLVDSTRRVVVRDTHAPNLAVSSPASEYSVLPTGTDSLLVQGTWVDSTLSVVRVDGVVADSGRSGPGLRPFALKVPLDVGPNAIAVDATDRAGNRVSYKRFVFVSPAGGAGRDTSVTALGRTQFTPTEVTGFRSQVMFLYNAPDPVQKGIPDTNTFVSGSEAVVSGYVSARDFGGFGNVRVQVLGHEEFGYTETRADGRFDMVVNGGQSLVLRFLKDSFLEVQRRVEVPLQDFAILDTVALVGRSSRLYPVNTESRQAITGRFETDANGDRQLVLLFAAGTVCSLTTAAGVTTTRTQFNVRLKEYTVGPDGGDAMPADLPPTSAYTYCVEMGVAEAEPSSFDPNTLPTSIRFDHPVVTYTREFLGLPVGTALPSGYYDPATARWLPAEDGRVIEFLGTDGPLALLDTNGDGAADSPSQYAAIGIDSLERADVAALFRPGDRLWRARVDHFSSHDRNLNKDALEAAKADRSGFWTWLQSIIDQYCPTRGCVIESENRVLGERIPIAGTGYSLNYRSNRQPGDVAMRSINIPLTGSQPPQGLRKIHVKVDVAGQRYEHEEVAPPSGGFPANMYWPFTLWDGTNFFHSPQVGSVTATVRVGYEFPETYLLSTSGSGSSWSNTSGGSRTGGMSANGHRDVGRIIWTTHKVSLGAPSMASAGLYGWTISPHHFYDTNGMGALYRGDGRIRLGDRALAVTRVFAGSGWSSARSGTEGLPPDEGQTTTSRSVVPTDIAVSADGSLYYADADHRLIGRIDRDGKFHRIAGNGGTGGGVDPFPEGSEATSVAIGAPNRIALGSDGTVYFTVPNLNRLLSVTPDGKIHKFAGTGYQFHYAHNDSIENRHADSTSLSEPRSVAVSFDGNVFVGCDNRVLRFDVRRRAHVYAGTASSSGAPPDAVGRADSLALLETPEDLACDAQGNLMIAEYGPNYVYRVSPDGQRSTLLHVDTGGAPGLRTVTTSPDGAVYVGNDIQNACSYTNGETGVYLLGSDGTAQYVAGGLNPVVGFASQDGELARATTFGSVRSIAVGPDGALYVGQQVVGACPSFGIYRVATEVPKPVNNEIQYPSEDGREIYVFNTGGRHLRTVDAVTGIWTFQFGYDPQGRLTSITDAANQTTNIVREGGVTRIIAPLLQSTTLTPDGSGFLHEVRNPNDETWTLGCNSGGLLESFQNPRAMMWRYGYGSDGRLETERDSTQAEQHLELLSDGFTREVEHTSAEGRTTLFTVQQMVEGLKRHVVRGPDGVADSTRVAFGRTAPYGQINSFYHGEKDSVTILPVRDKRLGWFAPVESVTVVKLPETGLTLTLTRSRGFAPESYDSPTNEWTETTTLNGNRWLSSYETAQRRYTWRSPLERTTTVDLDAAGRPSLLAAPGVAPVRLAYHSNGKLQVVQQGDRGWRYSYDVLGNLTSISDTLDHVTSFLDYDAAGRPHRQDLPGNRTVFYHYDANGNLDSLTTPGGYGHGFGYTPRDEIDRYSPPPADGAMEPSTRFTYDLDRALNRVDRPGGSLARFVYGATTGQLDSVSLDRGRISFEYLPGTGQLESVMSPDSVTVTYTYDGPLIRQEMWSGRVSGTVHYEHDESFRDAEETVIGANGSFPVMFQYDADGALQSVGSLMTLTHDQTTGFLTGTQAGGVTSTYGYDSYGALHTLEYGWQNGGVFAQVIDRDVLGRVTRVTESGIVSGVREYRYDAAGRLDTVLVNGTASRWYEYDQGQPGNGNRTAEVAAEGPTLLARGEYDAQDRLVRYGIPAAGQQGNGFQLGYGDDAAYEYTAAGELARKVTADTVETRYTYDALGNLTGVHLPNGDSLVYLIDGANRRVGRVRNGVLERTWLYGAGPAPLAELDGAGQVVHRYVYATTGHSPDLLVTPEATYRVVTDYLGSVRAVVRVSDGYVAQRIDYDAWGVRTADPAPAFQGLGFAGGLTDVATGLVRFGARDYDPSVGRWTAKDPTGFIGGVNLYTYAWNRPTGFPDADGKRPDNGEPITMDPFNDLYQHYKDIQDTRDRARKDARDRPLGKPYENAWEHALGGEYLRKRYGWAAASCMNIVKELQDYYVDRTQTRYETLKDWYDTQVGIDGDHRTPAGAPDTTDLIPDQRKPRRRPS